MNIRQEYEKAFHQLGNDKAKLASRLRQLLRLSYRDDSEFFPTIKRALDSLYAESRPQESRFLTFLHCLTESAEKGGHAKPGFTRNPTMSQMRRANRHILQRDAMAEADRLFSEFGDADFSYEEIVSLLTENGISLADAEAYAEHVGRSRSRVRNESARSVLRGILELQIDRV